MRWKNFIRVLIFLVLLPAGRNVNHRAAIVAERGLCLADGRLEVLVLETHGERRRKIVKSSGLMNSLDELSFINGVLVEKDLLLLGMGLGIGRISDAP